MEDDIKARQGNRLASLRKTSNLPTVKKKAHRHNVVTRYDPYAPSLSR
jgi:hypothetical protein